MSTKWPELKKHKLGGKKQSLFDLQIIYVKKNSQKVRGRHFMSLTQFGIVYCVHCSEGKPVV